MVDFRNDAKKLEDQADKSGVDEKAKAELRQKMQQEFGDNK